MELSLAIVGCGFDELGKVSKFSHIDSIDDQLCANHLLFIRIIREAYISSLEPE